MVVSSLIVFAGLGLGWWFYGRRPVEHADDPDPLGRLQPTLFHALEQRLYVDEFYEFTVIRLARWAASFSDLLDRLVWNGAVQLVSWLVIAAAWADSSLDTYVVNTGFDEGCQGVLEGGRLMSRLENGRVQNYLRIIGVALTVFTVFLIWGCKG